jgi:hypothetical protein
MRRSLSEKLAVGLSDRIFNWTANFLGDAILPWLLLWRVLRRKIPAWMAWDILWTVWAPFRWCRRWQGRRLVRMDLSYKGNDEFHPSLDMNLKAMLTMTEEERDEYLEDLARRRQRLHERDIPSRRK